MGIATGDDEGAATKRYVELSLLRSWGRNGRGGERSVYCVGVVPSGFSPEGEKRGSGPVRLNENGLTGLLDKAWEGCRDLPETGVKAPEDCCPVIFAVGAMSPPGSGRRDDDGSRKRGAFFGNDADTKDPWGL